MSLVKNTPVPVTAERLSELLAGAEQAAEAAAEITLRYFRADMLVENKAGETAFDPVTEADRQAEIAIRESLRVQFPDIGFYGEEHAAIVSDSGLTWVVDPIDGTRAFMIGMPLLGTLIGLFDGQDAILGVMDQPFLKERYIATAGTEARLYSASGIRSLRTRNAAVPADATMYCTTPDMFVSQSSQAAFQRVKAAARLTRYGGDCYAYALLASGFVDIVLDCDLKPYDIVALIPLIEAAGGVVSNWEGGSAVDGGYVLACASSELHAQTLELLQPG